MQYISKTGHFCTMRTRQIEFRKNIRTKFYLRTKKKILLAKEIPERYIAKEIIIPFRHLPNCNFRHRMNNNFKH